MRRAYVRSGRARCFFLPFKRRHAVNNIRMEVKRNVNAYVYGTRRRPITALNLHGYRKMLETYHRGDIVVAIDATMGALEDVGKIKVSENGLRPAGAFRKNAGRLGDVGIMAIVGEREGDMLLQLKTADPLFISGLARDVVNLVTSVNYR